MRKTSLRHALLMAAVFAGTAALVASPALAQTPPGPPACGGVASLMNLQLTADVPGPKGDNIVSIPAVSPVNNNPGSATTNGFFDLCRRFSLIGTTSTIQQFNAQAGTVATFDCSQAAAPTFTPGQAVLIRPTLSNAGRIPGVECTRPYIAYVEGPGVLGDNLLPVPVTYAGSKLFNICQTFGLTTAASSVARFHADTGTVDTVTCDQSAATAVLGVGEGVLFRPGVTTPGGGATPLIF
ncbi:MAG: hypothetical protein HY049_01680 [Acidobacteria bacterium]|nr:hypothetical protein [Acidobacteriota bacterium]